MIAMEVRACGADDLDHLRRSWPAPTDVASSHYAGQLDGHATFLIAWSDDEPLGYAVIQWCGPIGTNAKAAFPDAAEVTHLHVRQEHRNRGAGTALVNAAEKAIAKRNLALAAISVSLKNAAAARLYDRSGYQRTSISDVSAYDWVDDAGAIRHEREVNELLIKRL